MSLAAGAGGGSGGAAAALRKLLLGGSPRPYQLSLLDWQQSVFWCFMGVVAVSAAISSTNRRIRAEYGRLELQRQKNELLGELVRVQRQAASQQQRLLAAEAALGRDGGRWQRWAALRGELLAALDS